MSPDMLTAYVLWSAHPDCEGAAQYELQSRFVYAAPVIGASLFLLGMKGNLEI